MATGWPDWTETYEIARQPKKLVDSTAIPLLAGGEWNSAPVSSLNSSWLYFMLKASQALTWYLQVSNDGSAWLTLGEYAVPANTQYDLRHYIPAKFGRLRIVNGATNQTWMRVFLLAGWAK